MDTFEELKRCGERNFQGTIGGAQGLNAGERRFRDKVSRSWGECRLHGRTCNQLSPLCDAKFARRVCPF